MSTTSLDFFFKWLPLEEKADQCLHLEAPIVSEDQWLERGGTAFVCCLCGHCVIQFAGPHGTLIRFSMACLMFICLAISCLPMIWKPGDAFVCVRYIRKTKLSYDRLLIIQNNIPPQLLYVKCRLPWCEGAAGGDWHLKYATHPPQEI